MFKLNKKILQKSHLAQAIQDCLRCHSIPKTLLFGLSCVCACYVSAQAETTDALSPNTLSTQPSKTLNRTLQPLSSAAPQATVTIATPAATPKTQQAIAQQQLDAEQRRLAQQEAQLQQQAQQFQSEAVYQLSGAAVPQVDQKMVNQIYQDAEQAQQQAQLQEREVPNAGQLIQSLQSQTASAEQAPASTVTERPVEQYLSEISAQPISLPTQLSGRDIVIPELAGSDDAEQKRGFFKRLFHREKTDNSLRVLPKIKLTVQGDNKALNANLEAKFSTFTVAAFEDYSIALPQIRILATQAAQALGYYHAEFKFSKTAADHLNIWVKANQAATVTTQQIEFFGAGAEQPVFRAIQLAPDLQVGDQFNHGLYESSKSRINAAASDQGYFDGYWRMHDAKVSLAEDAQPTQRDRVDIQLRYETGARYKLDQVEFRMHDPNKPFPLKESVLRKLVPFNQGSDYASWRINLLSNNLINSRYFNNASVDVIKPDAIEKPPELPSDLQALLEKEQGGASSDPAVQAQAQEPADSTKQQQLEESIFAGTEETTNAQQRQSAQQAATAEDKEDQLKAQARATKQIPVVVTLNADKLNNLEAGVGYGTDTGFRLRSQYRRSIVNASGHSFESNMELSQIRQAIDGSYSIPYKDPLNDYFNLVGGYEREDRGDVGQNVQLDIESAVLGAERVIKKPLGEWQQTMSVRYRLDRLTTKGAVDQDDIPDAFRVISDDPEQESLLMGYEISRTIQDNRINPNRGFRQFYQVAAGSKNLLTETDMAILSAGWRFIYSVGENYNHQFVGRADAGYIITNDFDRVPYNLRFFAGGDQSIRGYDYKSLSTEENDLLIGGQALAVGSLEYNYQFKPGWRAAVFADVGNAYDAEFKTETKIGVGVGVRWASPIGPIRIDVGAGVSEQNIPVRLHVFIGPAL
jgi:translocation and assembly module TamA